MLAFKVEPPYKPQIGENEFFDQKLVKQTEFDDTILDEKTQKQVVKGKDLFKGFSK